MMQKRRDFLKLISGCGALGLLLGATGCGFQLRASPKFEFKTLWLGGPSRITEEVRRFLRDVQADVVVVSDPQSAQVFLEIDKEELLEIVVGQTPTGQVREKQLRMKVSFRMWAQGKDPVASQSVLEQLRESSYSETQALAKSEEEALLYEDMRRSIAQQLVWRLSAVQL